MKAHGILLKCVDLPELCSLHTQSMVVDEALDQKSDLAQFDILHVLQSEHLKEF